MNLTSLIFHDMNLKRTSHGLEYQVFTKVDKKWDDYDQMVGKSQLKRFK